MAKQTKGKTISGPSTPAIPNNTDVRLRHVLGVKNLTNAQKK